MDKLLNIKKPVLFAGIGNSLKSDDCAGILLVEKLKSMRLKTINCGEVPENYTKELCSHKDGSIIFCDAVDINKEPGSFALYTAEDILSTSFFTHGASLDMLITFLKFETKADIYLLAIQPEKITLGSSISSDVKKSIYELADLIQGELKCMN